MERRTKCGLCGRSVLRKNTRAVPLKIYDSGGKLFRTTQNRVCSVCDKGNRRRDEIVKMYKRLFGEPRSKEELDHYVEVMISGRRI